MNFKSLDERYVDILDFLKFNSEIQQINFSVLESPMSIFSVQKSKFMIDSIMKTRVFVLVSGVYDNETGILELDNNALELNNSSDGVPVVILPARNFINVFRYKEIPLKEGD